MSSRFHTQLINDPFGDPGLYVEFMFEKRAILFDLGDLKDLPARKLLRVSDVFVSHMHMDHFCGFDRLLRLMLGREQTLRLYGPAGLIYAVGYKLAAYTWNLVEKFDSELTLAAAEIEAEGRLRRAEFRCRSRFRREKKPLSILDLDRLLTQDGFDVAASVLDHDVPCLAFALRESAHVNIWKNRIGWSPSDAVRLGRKAQYRGIARRSHSAAAMKVT